MIMSPCCIMVVTCHGFASSCIYPFHQVCFVFLFAIWISPTRFATFVCIVWTSCLSGTYRCVILLSGIISQAHFVLAFSTSRHHCTSSCYPFKVAGSEIQMNLFSYRHIAPTSALHFTACSISSR